MRAQFIVSGLILALSFSLTPFISEAERFTGKSYAAAAEACGAAGQLRRETRIRWLSDRISAIEQEFRHTRGAIRQFLNAMRAQRRRLGASCLRLAPDLAPEESPLSTPISPPVRLEDDKPLPPVKPEVIPTVQELPRWERNMVDFGRQHCDLLRSGGADYDTLLSATYYDAQWVFEQIGDYTGDPYWRGCAEAAGAVYRDRYVEMAGGTIPGYWIFTHGLAEDYLRNGDTRSREALLSIVDHAAFARPQTRLSETFDSTLSRETAYSIMAYLNAERVGRSKNARLEPLVDQALGHLDQWFVSENAAFLQPFMVGLTAHALIMYHDSYRSSAVVPALMLAMDRLWGRFWVPESSAFLYIDREVPGSDPPTPTPDLNLLIAPIYAWLYRETGEVRFLERGDQIFSGGVRQAYLARGKQFNQNYRLSFSYLRWRSER